MNKFFKRLALLLAVLMIVSMMPVQLFADNSVTGEEQSNGTGEASGNSNAVAKIGDTGYETLAEAIAAANGNGTVTLLTATTELVQALLDGQYGSFDGLTIELPAGDYGKLELGRATKYAGSNTEYFVGGFDSTAKNYKAFTNADEIREYKGQSTWTPNCFYRRALNNVTIKAADNATVTIEKISADAGQIYGKADAPKYDYVLDVEIPDTNKSYWMALAWNNVTFEGINFKSSVNIESSSEKTLIDGLHFENCKFNSGYTALAAANDPNKASKGMGIRFVSWTKTTNNLRNLTVNNCTFEDCSEGVYTNPVYGVSVTNSSFNNINHNAVAIQDVDSAVNHGNVVISGNTFTNVSDRIIRFNNAGEDTTITITGNTSVNSGDSDGEIIKATTMPDSVNINMTSNTWGDVNGKTAVIGNGFNKVVVALVGGVGYTTLADAIANANPDANGVITYEISGKANVDSTGWIQVARAGLTGLTKVEFVGKTPDAEICITNSTSVLADQLYDIDVSFTALVLSHPNGAWVDDLGHATNYFACLLRNTNAAENTVTYTNCTFPNGLCNNQYGKTVVDDCKFTNATSGKYNLWNYGGNTEIKNSTFTGVRGIKTYNEGILAVAPTVKIENTTFNGLTEKAAIVASKPVAVTVENVSVSGDKGFFTRDITGNDEVMLKVAGTGISGIFNITSDTNAEAAKEEFNISAGTFTSEVSSDYLADGFEVKDNGDGTYGVAAKNYVAAIGDAYYSTLQEAIDAATRNSIVTLLADTKENVTISTPYVTLDLNGHTLNGSTGERKPALTVTARVTVKDSSEAQTGTIMREDTAENSGVSSHYVIDIQGNGWLTFESGNVTNDSGAGGTKGASLVRVGSDSVAKYPGLNIKGGTFKQDNFIVIKVERGDLFLNGGSLNSANSYAVQTWHRATIKGGTVNGAVSSWTYDGGPGAETTISGGTVNGNVEAISYDGKAGKPALVSISGGTVNGTLIAGIYNSATEPTKDMATIEITGGTFSSDPTKYLVEGSTVTPNSDGTFGVEKAYLAQVGENKYYTMDEAFKAQTASGEPIVLLRDYTTGSTFNSGTVARVVDLNGHTWTCTGTDANSAAFEINNPNASLTVKNGKIVSSQLVGLIPSAMGGTIKYDNSSLTFENVQMSTTATSGIETNGNNTNDTVKLVNSTLNVPNGFGIYFPSSGELIIENSKITAKTMGVQVCSGALSISGANTAIIVTGDAVEKTENDGAIQDGAAISIVNRTGYKGLDTVTVSGGTFTAKKGNSAIKAYDWENKTESVFTASAKVAVSGGTFSSEVSEDLCAEGFIPTKNADGTYDVKAGKYVAQIGSTKYETLEEAIVAANAGDTVTLLADVTADVVINKNITLDLGGKTLTNTGAGKATISVTGGTVTVKNGTVIGGTSYYNIEVTKGSNANLTLEDVTATAGNTGSSMIDNWGTLTITSGTYSGGLNVVKSEEGSTLVIKGGKFTLDYAPSSGYTATILVYGDTTITGGEFIQSLTTTGSWAHPQVVMTGIVDGYTAITRVTGGTFTNKKSGEGIFRGLGKATSDNFEVSGGTFNKSVSESYCADGFIPTKNADGTYGVKEGMYVAKVGSTKYETLADAIRLAAKGKTITLLADINTPEKTYEITKNLTIDLNGKTVTGSGYDGVFEVTGKNIEVVLNATNGGKVIAVENSGSAGKYAMAVWMCGTGSTLTINGGEFIQNITSTDDKQMDMIYASAGTIIINSGSFTSGTPKWTLNIKDSAYKAGTANIIVNGGTFTGYDPRNAENEGKGTSLVADGVGIDKNADGTFTAKSGMAAQIVDTDGNSVAAYAGHYDAIKAAKDGETVILLSDRKNFVTNTVNANITIDLNGKTLSVGNNNPFFRTNGEVTIQNGTIDSQYACVIVNAYNKLTLKNVKITGVTGDNGKNLVNVCSNAEVTIDKDTVLTASGSNGAAVFIGQDMDAKYTLNVYGKVIQESKSFAISGNGSYKGTTTINIYDGAEVKSASVAIYHPQAGVINVNGGLVEGYCAIGIKSGTLNINGGTVRGTADDHVLDDSNSTSGTITYDGSAIIVDSRSTGYAGNVNINVTGGTVESYYSTAIREIGEQDKTDMTQLTKLNVIGGSVLGASKNPVNVTSDMLVRDISVINISVSGGTFKHAIPDSYCADRYIPAQNADGTYGVQKAMKGSEKNPYTLKELSEMTRAQYIAAQEALGDTMYVEIGNYSYGTNGVLGNGVRNDTPGQTPDHSKLNAYAENGYLGEKNDGANGKNIIFVGGSIESGVTGYTSIDNIGTSLLLAVPAYTNVTFEGVTFNNVMSFDYQLYTSPWSQLGELKFSGCTFNGIIVGAIAAQTLTFDGCTFTAYTNTASENNSNPTWIRPAYGNWTKGDNEGQGNNFKSLTTINFINNTVTSTRPVKFERIAQWEMDTKVTVTGNEFDIKSDGSSKNVGLYFGANAKFDLVVDNNKKTDGTAALYTAVYKAPNGTDYAGLPAGSTVKDSNGADVEVAGVIWKTTDALTLKTTTEAVEVGGVKFATLEEAFAAAKNGDTITLLSDVEMTEIIRVTDSKKITLALNGFNVTITATGKFIRVCNAELTITGNGTIKERNPYFAPIIIKGGAEGSENYSVVNIKEGVTLEGWAGVMIDQTLGTANNYGMVLNVEGATLNGVNDTDGASGSGIYVNGVVEDAKITLTDTTVTGTGTGMYLAGNADTTINGGSVKGDATGIEIRAGKLTLNNCDVTGGNEKVTADANGNGTTVTNAALAISQHTTKKPIEVIINGGTFNGTAAVYQTDVQNTDSVDVKIAVNDGTFNGTISGETDGAIVISGGKFKFKVDDKYFKDGYICSGKAGDDGYYTIAGQPITTYGLSIGEGLSLRIYLLDGVTTGKLRVTYTKPDGEEVSYIIDETEFELVGNEENGYTEKYFFRIFNITPQMADMTITVQYIGEDGKDFGSAKEVSILKYCEGYIAKYPTENVKTFVSKLLEYCASAMDYVAIKYSEQVYNGKTWTERATALRAEKERLCGTDVPTFDFKELGTNSKFGRKIFDTNGIIFGESLTFYLGIRKENYNPDYHYIPTGSNETKPVFDEKSGEYRFYFTMAPYEYNTSMRIVVKSGNSTICERATSLDFLLNKYSDGDSAAARFCKAAYEYCRALEAVIKDINK